MGNRERFKAYLDGRSVDRVPRIESKFAPDTVERWRAQGHLDDRTPEDIFELDPHDSVPTQMRKFDPPDDPREIWHCPERWYDPRDARRFPDDWGSWCGGAADGDTLVSFEPWHEGMFQVLGIREFASFAPVLLFVIDEPRTVERILDVYTGYLEAMIDRVCERVTPDYAILYEPIASNQGPIISPEMARRYLAPCYARVCQRLEHYGIRNRFIWSSGRILSFIPLWLDSGLNGLFVDQACAAGVDYVKVRNEYGPRLALMGGIDNAAVRGGGDAIRRELQRKVPPLLDSGRSIPGLDDTVRATMPYERFVEYRERLLDMVEGE